MENKYITNAHGYKYDKRIFWVALALIIMLFGFIAQSENFDFNYYFYFECTEDICINPLMELKVENAVTGFDYREFCTEPWCTENFLTRGIYGRKVPWILERFTLIAVFHILIALLLNHFLYNRGKTPRVSFNMSEKWKNKFKNLEED